MHSAPDCPVDFVPVNEYKVKIIAFGVFLLCLLFAIQGWPVFAAILFADFTLRSLKLNRFSPLSLIAEGLVRMFRMGNVPVNAAPKRFAALMGLAISLLVLLSWYSGFGKTALGLSVVLAVFSFLEWSFGFCAGCYIYSFLQRSQR